MVLPAQPMTGVRLRDSVGGGGMVVITRNKWGLDAKIKESKSGGVGSSEKAVKSWGHSEIF